MRLLDFAAVPPREVAPGYLGRYLHSDQILSGSFELTVSGTAHVLQPGQVLYIAPHERHSARALTACVVLDVFHPPRDDYR